MVFIGFWFLILSWKKKSLQRSWNSGFLIWRSFQFWLRVLNTPTCFNIFCFTIDYIKFYCISSHTHIIYICTSLCFPTDLEEEKVSALPWIQTGIWWWSIVIFRVKEIPYLKKKKKKEGEKDKGRRWKL